MKPIDKRRTEFSMTGHDDQQHGEIEPIHSGLSTKFGDQVRLTNTEGQSTVQTGRVEF